MNQLFARKINFTSVAEDTSITAAVKSVMLLVQHSIFSSIMEYLAPKKKTDQKIIFRAVLVKISIAVKQKYLLLINCIADYFFNN